MTVVRIVFHAIVIATITALLGGAPVHGESGSVLPLILR